MENDIDIELIAERVEQSSLSEARYIYIRSFADRRLRVARIASHEPVYGCSAICAQVSSEAEAIALLANATGPDYLSGELVAFDAERTAREVPVFSDIGGGVKLFCGVRKMNDHQKSALRCKLAAEAGNPVARRFVT